MNHKNPGLAEQREPISIEEQGQFYRHSALGWTIAAILYTTHAFWKGNPHRQETALLGWLIAAWSWGYWFYEQRKASRQPLSK